MALLQRTTYLFVLLVLFRLTTQSTVVTSSSTSTESTIPRTVSTSTTEATTTTPLTTTALPSTTTPPPPPTTTTTSTTTTTTTTTTPKSTTTTLQPTSTTSTIKATTSATKTTAATSKATTPMSKPETSVAVVVDKPTAASSIEEDLKAENKILTIAVGVLAGVIGLAIIGVTVYCIHKRRRARPPFLTEDEDEPTFRHEKRNYFRPSSSFDPVSSPKRTVSSSSETEPMTAKVSRDMNMETFTFTNGSDGKEKKKPLTGISEHEEV